MIDEKLLGFIRLRCEEVGECWIWKQSTTPAGYPRATLPGNNHTYAHIAAWNATHDKAIPSHMIVRRTCGDRLCCNPAHLTLITRANSNKLAASKGAWRGPARIAKIIAAQRRKAKITMDEAREIRASTEPGTELAARFGVSRSLISRIRLNKSWREGPSNASVFNQAIAA